MKLPNFSPGHFYSAIVDTDAIRKDRERIWPSAPEVLGVDFDDASHLHVLEQVLPRQLPDYDYPEDPADCAEPTQFYTTNSQFSWLDARVLFALLREWRPRRVIE